jgi:hypothetical protein
MSPRLLILIGLVALTSVFYLFSSVSALTTSGVLIGYIILYRVCLFSINTPLTALNVNILSDDQVRMGQGLLGMVRNIGAGLGVTITSAIFERRRTYHQLLAYTTYNAASPEHIDTMREIAQSLRHTSVGPTDINAMTLRTLRRQMDIESVAAGFRDSFFTVGFCFLVAMLPMLLISIRRTDTKRAG